MPEHAPTESRPPRETIAAALAQIEAAYPLLRFNDARERAAAHEYSPQGVRAIRYHLRNAAPGRESTPAVDERV